MKSLFVGNLPWSVTDEDLKTKFSEFGEVAGARVVTDKFTGKSRGFGFVDMNTGAEQAIEKMSNYDWSGRKITVNEAKPRADKSDRM